MKDLLKAESNTTTPATASTAALKSVTVKGGKLEDDFLYGDELLKNHREKDPSSSLWTNLESKIEPKGKSESEAILTDREKLMKKMREEIELEAKVNTVNV